MEKKLETKPREGHGKGVARKIRARGAVPAVMYGRDTTPVHIEVDARDLFHVLHTEAGMNVLIDLRVNGERHLTLARDVQRDIVRGQFLHADFLKIAHDEKITVDVPIALTGESAGVKEGGVVEHHLWELRVECLPTDVPQSIEADISALAIGDALKVEDLKLPVSVTVLTPLEESVVAVVPPPILKLEEEEVAEAVEGEEAAEGAEGEGAPAAEGEGAPAAEGGGSAEGESGGEG
ncbi:MAG TPA: 50S ribosomal protein L25 [Actinomycetota bacterium]|nr:50S ribosomal protein L25 [Actinomycetota bacterium]